MVLIDFDFRFIEISHELYAIRRYIDSIDQQLPDLIQEEEKRAYERLKQTGYENDEAESQIMNQESYELIEVTLPKYFLGSTLVTIWAIFESGISEIAAEIKSRKNLGIGLSDINGDVIDRVNKYFNHILDLPIETRSKAWQQLRMLYVLRNAIAHANGRLENVKSRDDIKKIENWAKSDIGIQTVSGNILFTTDFVKKTHSIIFDFLDDLIKKVKKQYPKSANNSKKDA
jgi:hypothetical protein